MVRLLVEQSSIGDYKFEVDLDSSSAPDKHHLTCWVSKDERPLLDKSGSPVRKYFPLEIFNNRYFIKFCMKFANDERYRSTFL